MNTQSSIQISPNAPDRGLIRASALVAECGRCEITPGTRLVLLQMIIYQFLIRYPLYG